MRRRVSTVVGLAAAVAVAWALSAEPLAAGQRTRSGGGSTDRGKAVPRGSGGASGPTTRDGGGGSSGTSSTAPVDRGSPDQSGTASAPPARRDGSSAAAGERSREGRDAVGRAVPRTVPRRDDRVVLVPRYYPWGYGGYGGYYSGYYGGGYYDPWGPYGGGYYYPSYYSRGYEGGLRLKVQPSDASVFVDGYYAGEVDEFDNIFQRLPIEPGPHRIEVRADGYEPMVFEVRILPGRTLTYRGELRRLP